MEFLESLRRLEEDIDSFQEFEQLPVHTVLEERFKSTLYLGRAAEGISLPVADVAVDLFQNAAEKNLGTFTRRHVAKFNRNGQINPSSSMLGMMYARRLKRQKSDYLKKVTSTELFLVSMMLATKFLYDEGEDEEIFSDEWADSAKMDVKRVNELEREFLDAIDWDLYIRPDEFYEFLQQMETWIALKEGQRRGWFSYSDFNVLMDHKDWFATMALLLEQATKVLGICMAVYSLCGATLCWSLLVMQHHHSSIPGMMSPDAAADHHSHSHVFHGLRPIKSTQVATHQSEILLPPPAEPSPLDEEPLESDAPVPCPRCRRCCCGNAPGSSAAASEMTVCPYGSPKHADSDNTRMAMDCNLCPSGPAEDFWLRKQIGRARKATISFYHALVVAYYDALMETPPVVDHGERTSPARSRAHHINRSASQGDHRVAAATPQSRYPSDPKCPHPSREMRGNLNKGDSDAATLRRQCSVCEGVGLRGKVRETIHLLLPSYSVESAIGLTSGTIPVIVA